MSMLLLEFLLAFSKLYLDSRYLRKVGIKYVYLYNICTTFVQYGADNEFVERLVLKLS